MTVTAGAFLYLDPDGTPQVAGGYVRPEDEQHGQDAEHHEPDGDQEGIPVDGDGADEAEPGRVADRPQASEVTDPPTITLRKRGTRAPFGYNRRAEKEPPLDLPV